MSRYALGYVSVGVCSLLIFTPSVVSQEIDAQWAGPLHYEQLASRLVPGPAPPLPGELLYYVTPLGGLRDWAISTDPWGINQLGQVTGTSLNPDVDREAFLWDPVEGMIGLGDLPGGDFQSYGYAVNNLGHVAGRGRAESDLQAMFWTPEDGMISLAGYPGWGSYGIAVGINDLDQVVGEGRHLGYGREAFLWDAELGLIGLGDLPGAQYYSQPWGVNNAGEVTGFSTSGEHLWGEGLIWDKANGMRPLWGTPPGVYAWTACDINELGQITGTTDTGEAYLWDPQAGLMPLGRLQPGNHQTCAYGLNDVGQVVGQYDPDWDPRGAFIWDAEHGMRDLETLIAAGTDPNYADLLLARRINSAGQIIAKPMPCWEGVVLNPFVLGDLNCDELVDEQDLGALLLILLDPEEYAQTYPDCPGQWAGDINQDGVLDPADLYALRDFLIGPPSTLPAADDIPAEHVFRVP